MAFSFRKIISNINYFRKPEDEDKSDLNYEIIDTSADIPEAVNISAGLEHSEADSTCKTLGSSMLLPDSVRNFAVKKGSLSDTDILTANVDSHVLNKPKRKCKKLKLDIKQANQSSDSHSSGECEKESYIENTPKQMLLQCKSSEVYNERLKLFDFNKSFHLDENYISDEQLSENEEDQMDIQSISEASDSDASTHSSDKKLVKMCRKVDVQQEENTISMPSVSPESFADVELDKNDEERMSLLINYQTKLEKIEHSLKKLLIDFQFHIEVSKVFNNKDLTSSFPNGDINNIPKITQNINDVETEVGALSPSEPWDLITESEDKQMKNKVKDQLLTIKQMIEIFTELYLSDSDSKSDSDSSKKESSNISTKKGNSTFNLKHNVTFKKKLKYFDYPDFRDAMLQLFDYEDVTNLNDLKEDETQVLDSCKCSCHSSESQTDSGLTDKTDQSLSNQSISSSIGNFTLNSSTLSAFSESLDQIISYNSFDDTSLYCIMLKKPAIERITFYVQVHSIQINAEESEEDYEIKNIIVFHCPSCKTREREENGLLKHILSELHCEKIHFIYKTAYINRCVATGQDIQPSTVLNPMRVYRDDNKIVCFGDAKYACSLCFESVITGESMLMAHCSESEHIDRRQRLSDILD